MKKYILLLFIAAFAACTTKPPFKGYHHVTVKPLYENELLSIRAIDTMGQNLAFAGSNNSYGMYNAKTNSTTVNVQKYDTLALEFRAVAHTQNDFFMLAVGNPGLLYKTGDDGKMKIVYKEEGEKVFYDAMQFWNDKEGIAIGDPTDGCLSVIITRDGGNTWEKLTLDTFPKAADGEAAFAASNTNIAIKGDNAWIMSGGVESNVYKTTDKGKTWTKYKTPAIQGKATQGMYSIAFYDEMNGVAIGGDYTKPEENKANKIITADGGKTWKVLAAGKNPGYRSCIQYIPNSDAEGMVAIGFKGIAVSNDMGQTWEQVADEGFYTLRFVNDSVAYAAGNGRIAKLTFN
ncbi:WD40/YVTN/BNR-like repeat-containing protein [Zhouia sp. PK063]|uniref:WD40/YVTN/BNR-like repeat-containing protein n=1 Tax=Zhouia sp. PK063 TaxID=3373602 RepID=UPI0037B9C54C